jgi:hypothetical protein
MLVILEDPDSDTEMDVETNGTLTNDFKKVKEVKEVEDKSDRVEQNNEHYKSDLIEENKENLSLEKQNDFENGLNEVTIPTDDLEEMSMDIESNGFYKIYEILDEKIKDNVIQNLQKIFNKKKIKLNVDLTDIFDEED